MKIYEVSVSIYVNVIFEQVWKIFMDLVDIKQFMFGVEVEIDWKEGSNICYIGEYNGKLFEEKGEILKVEKNWYL